MSFPLVLGTLFVGAVAVAALRQHLAKRARNRTLELGLKGGDAGGKQARK